MSLLLQFSWFIFHIFWRQRKTIFQNKKQKKTFFSWGRERKFTFPFQLVLYYRGTWDSLGRVITQTRARAFWSTDTLKIFENLVCKKQPFTSNKSPELVTKRHISVFNFEICFPFSLNLFLFSLLFFQILILESKFRYFTYVTDATN